MTIKKLRTELHKEMERFKDLSVILDIEDKVINTQSYEDYEYRYSIAEYIKRIIDFIDGKDKKI